MAPEVLVMIRTMWASNKRNQFSFIFQLLSTEKTMVVLRSIEHVSGRNSRAVRTLVGVLSIALFVLIYVPQALAQSNVYTDDNNVAINGYDVVNYFTANEAVRGSKEYSTQYQGTTFYFTSKEHKQMFLENPEAYLPQYGGYCAYAVAAMGKKVPVDPETFKVYNGELYLFFNDFYQGSPMNTIVPWNQNEQEMKQKADANWGTMAEK